MGGGGGGLSGQATKKITFISLAASLVYLENPLVEELLQLLVAVVDAKLLERVEREVLEAEDVEDADEVDLWGKRD